MENGGRVTSEQKRLIWACRERQGGLRYCEAHTVLAAKRFGASDERLRAVKLPKQHAVQRGREVGV